MTEKTQVHLISMYEKKLESLMGPAEYMAFATRAAKECFRLEIEDMADGEFKDFCLENLEKIVVDDIPTQMSGTSDLISRQAAIDLAYDCEDEFGKDVAFRFAYYLRQLPSAQPEIIHCGDCRYKDDGIDEDGIPFLKCLHGRSYGGTRINDFCSWAERRTNEVQNE